jgi:YVTN family beta-propeller protein
MMMKRKHYIFGLLLITIVFITVQGYRHSTAHVNKIMAGEPHSLNCMSCHAYTKRGGLLTKTFERQYLSPFNLDVGKKSRKLYVLAQDAERLLVVNPLTNKVESSIQLDQRPHTIKIDDKEEKAYVSNQWSNSVWVIDLNSLTVTDTIQVGGGPAGLDFDAEGDYLFVANTYTDNISIINLKTGKETRRLAAGNEPIAVATSPDGKSVVVSSRRTLPVKFRTAPKTEVTVINAQTHRVKDRKHFTSGHILENITYSPEGDLVFATMIMPKNLVPSVQIEQGWMMNHGLGVFSKGKNGELTQFLLDEPNAFYADPFDIIISADGRLGFVSHSGADMISVIDIAKIRQLIENGTEHDLDRIYPNHLGLSSEFVVKRISTGANPKGMEFSADGQLLYIIERLEDRIAILDVESLEIVDHINLSGQTQETTVRLGAKMFTSAKHTFHQQYSCYTCHPDGHEDGLTYDMSSKGGDRNLVNVQTLRDLGGTGPYKWNGTNTSIYMQCGMRFSKFITRTEAFTADDLDALVAYIVQDLTHPPNIHHPENTPFSPAQLRGKTIFERTKTNDGQLIPPENRCLTCHPPPNYSNFISADVGTLKENDDPTLFDSPNLNNVYESAPYLHDGSAATLEEIWTVYNDNDEHGVANDMTKDQLNDLVEYLKALGAAKNYLKIMN